MDDIPALTRAHCQTEIEGRAGASRKSGLGPLFGGTDIPAGVRVCCQTETEGRAAARWRGPPAHPEKAALVHYSGADIPARPRALPDRN